MVCFTPEIYGEGVYFRNLLGSCETKHNTNENRNTNLRILCEALNGKIIQPGEEFSYNECLGERTEEKGYKPAPAYSGSRLVDSVGGGVCQGSSTLYNCVLLADLEVVTRLCHGATVSYLPIGLDAAVNWGTTDFVFRNNWNFPVKIEAEVSDGYVKMKILGTDEKDYYIKMTSGYDDSHDGYITAVSYKNKYSKETDELISKEREAFSTYYTNIG
jgi:vancomycin resistance protein YoaR